MWKDILKEVSIRDREMYMDAIDLFGKVEDNVSLDDIQEFHDKYDAVSKMPVEWPTMHDYLLAVAKKYVEIHKLNEEVLKVIKTETDEALG